jgi:hypothetical protein
VCGGAAGGNPRNADEFCTAVRGDFSKASWPQKGAKMRKKQGSLLCVFVPSRGHHVRGLDLVVARLRREPHEKKAPRRLHGST